MDEQQETVPVVVVGVDGSEHSLEALRWAAREAGVTGARLHVVTAWSYPEHPTPFGIVPGLPLPPDPLAEAHRILALTVARVVGDPAPIEVVAEVIEGEPAQVLLDASRRAQLLVVGSRGHGTFTGMLLGSVSERCAHHAACPVVITRRPTDGP